MTNSMDMPYYTDEGTNVWGTGNFGFKNRMKRGWRVTKLGMHVVKADPELMVYLLFSGIMSVLSFGAVLTFTGGIGFVIGMMEVLKEELRLALSLVTSSCP